MDPNNVTAEDHWCGGGVLALVPEAPGVDLVAGT